MSAAIPEWRRIPRPAPLCVWCFCRWFKRCGWCRYQRAILREFRRHA